MTGEGALDSVADTVVDVAVGILLRPNGEILLGQRPQGKPYAGYWEFPGGKVEAGEAIVDALRREFLEELGVQIVTAEPWCCVAHVYPHAHVHLHFYICRQWLGQPQSLEGQAFAWQAQPHDCASPALQPLLPATLPLLSWLDQLRFAPTAVLSATTLSQAASQETTPSQESI
jgi:8-oxo-dGTP diphosphatase